tara:strand:+ start:166 stop:345 length:180 start_codon:yes stop_codon:yes gene_type:complete
MDDIIDLIATDSSSSDVSDRIKDMLYAKAADKIDGYKPAIANSVFDEVNPETEPTQEEE